MTLQEFLDEKYTKVEQKNLTHLICSNNNNITILNRIEKLTNLTKLYCHYNNLTSLIPIYRLDKLERLYTDIKFESIKQLKLDIKSQRRKDIIKNILKW